MATTTLTLTRASWAVIGMTDAEIDYNSHTGSTFTSPQNAERALLIRYSPPQSSYLHRRILSSSMQPSITWLTASGGHAKFHYGALTASFAASTVTRRNYGGLPSVPRYLDQYQDNGTTLPMSVDASACIGNGIMLAPFTNDGEPLDYGNIGTYPTLKVILDGSNVSARIESETAPSVINSAAENIFRLRWTSDPCLEPISVTDCELHYRVDDGEYTVRTPLADGTMAYICPIAGNLLSGSIVQYYWVLTDSLGNTVTGETHTLSSVHRIFTSTEPKSGTRADRFRPIVFSFYGYNPTGVSLKYRIALRDTWTTLPVTAGNRVTLPADSLIGANYEYCFSGTDQYGNPGTGDIVSFSTIDTFSTASADSPQGVTVNLSDGIRFQWTHIQESGSRQTAAELQISDDSTTWETLASVSGAETSVIVPSGTLTSGTWYWRVRTRNLDGVAGAWSEPTTIIVMTSATVPIVSVSDTSPRPTVMWQTSEQEAIELLLDGKLYREFGTAKIWKPPVYLSDGEHRVDVRTVNMQGLWSEWGSVIFEVSNAPSNPLTLTVQTGYRAELSWSNGGYDFYLIYRENVPIAKVSQISYTDELSVGSTSYAIRGGYDGNGNYGLSNTVTVDVRPRWPVLIDVETGTKIDLDVSDDEIREIEHGAGMSFASYKVAGRTFPVKVGTGFGESTTELKAAFASLEELRSFDMFLHRLVCLKTSARAVIGLLETVRTVHNGFYYVVDFKISACDYPQEIDIDSGVRYG